MTASVLKRVVSLESPLTARAGPYMALPAVDHASAQKPGTTPTSPPLVWGPGHESASLLFPARGLGPPVGVGQAAPRLGPPRPPAPAALQAQHAAPPALQRAHTVCRPHLHATLRPVGARGAAAHTAPAGTARSHASHASPSLYRGDRHARLPPAGHRFKPGHPALSITCRDSLSTLPGHG